MICTRQDIIEEIMTTILRWSATAAAATFAVAVLAHGGATGIVKERMDDMITMSKAIKALTPIMQGDQAYDAATVRTGAEVIANASGAHMLEKFPEGSLQTASEARDEIWTGWDDFSRLANELEVLALGLAQAADNGLMADGRGAANTMTMMDNSSNTMMGMMATTPNAQELAAMPADGVFTMLVRTCSGCHTQYRREKK